MSIGDIIYLVPSQLWPFLNKAGPYVIFYIECDTIYYILDNDGYTILVTEEMVDKRKKKGWQRS